MKLKPFKKEKLTNKQKKILIALSSLCFIFLFIAIYQSFAAYNIKHSERIVDAKVGSLHDIRVLAIYIDGEPQPNMTEFPKDKEFSHVRCYVEGEYRENITGTWENDSLTIKPFTSKTDCNVYFLSHLLRDKIISDNGGESAIVARGTPDYSAATGNGLFKTNASIPGWTNTNQGLFSGTSATHEGGDSYYYRGNIDNNHVRFAGFWWRIIRIEGNGNIRLIYNGTLASNPTPPPQNGNTVIGQSRFNENDNHNRFIGFMFGSATGTYAEQHANTTSSTIKTSLESWYINNLLTRDGGRWNNMIARNTIFCNDRNLVAGTGLGTTTTSYGSEARRVPFVSARPSLQCINRTAAAGLSTVPTTHDQFSAPNSENRGNQRLTHPIGLITWDEAVIAGNFADEGRTSTVWISGRPSWSITPSTSFTPTIPNAVVFWRDIGNGSMGWVHASNASQNTRPVISLNSDVRSVSGNGTRVNPYIIN